MRDIPKSTSSIYTGFVEEYFFSILISRYPDTCVLEEEERDGRYLVLPKNAVGDLIRWITAPLCRRLQERRRVGSSRAWSQIRWAGEPAMVQWRKVEEIHYKKREILNLRNNLKESRVPQNSSQMRWWDWLVEIMYWIKVEKRLINMVTEYEKFI